jgi:plastocyanin
MKASIRWMAWMMVGLTGCAGLCFAGDVVGTVSVPKPDHVLVYVEAVKGTFPASNSEMDQHNKVFDPYVLPVLNGATVAFHNNDNLAHNVFGIGADNFNLGTFGKAAVREHTFNKTGDVTVLCNIHSEMEAHILVLQNPYFARPDGQGKFHIAGVPAGDYVVRAWYSGKTRKQDVKVPASGSVSANF